MKRVCDLITEFLIQKSVKDIFMVSGGGSMFLTDGLASNDKINKICCHHEQAVAMAVTGYAKYKGFGCGFVTTGCGGTNTITGLLNAWQDSTPCMFISGQCKTKELIGNVSVPIRQFGVQEADIVSLVQSITKYAVTIKDANKIIYELEKAYEIANEGRPGPVWIDVPIDIQQAYVEEDQLIHFKVEKKEHKSTGLDQVVEDLNQAKRPVIIAGHGIRLANGINEFEEFIEKYNIPFVFSRLGFDLLPGTHPLNIGGIGNTGTRHGNFAVQNADYVLVLGSRLCVSTTGYTYELFAREAKVCVVDIDENEHMKDTIHIDQFIHMDVRKFLEEIIQCDIQMVCKDWIGRCLEWKRKYPSCTREHYDASKGISMYAFVNELSKKMSEEAVVITDAGSTQYVPAQALITSNKKQRYITSGAQGEMGFSLPASVGVCVAHEKKETIVIVGDGSIQMNIQELQTISHNKLPVKIFVWDNDGYLSIRETQQRAFEGRYLGVDANSGVSFPDMKKLCDAYGIKYYCCEKIEKLGNTLEAVLKEKSPTMCIIKCIKDEKLLRTVSSKKLKDGRVISLPIEDMIPFLERKEFNENMIIEPVNVEE